MSATLGMSLRMRLRLAMRSRRRMRATMLKAAARLGKGHRRQQNPQAGSLRRPSSNPRSGLEIFHRFFRLSFFS